MGVRAMMVKDRRVLVNLGTRRVVVGDSETGKGAECCCEGGGACCERRGEYGCIDIQPPTTRGCGARVELRMHAIESLSAVGFSQRDSDGNEFTPSLIANGIYHAGVYWLLNAKLGAVCGTPTPCGTAIGLVGQNERFYSESGVTTNQQGTAESYAFSARQQGNPYFLDRDYLDGYFYGYLRGFDAPCPTSGKYNEILTPCNWTAFDENPSSIWWWLTARFKDDSIQINQSTSVMGTISENVGFETGSPPYFNRWVRGYFEFNPNGPDIFHPTEPCGDSYDPYFNYEGTGAGYFDFKWSATATPNGGSFKASLIGGFPDASLGNVSSYEAVSTGSWSMEVIDCDGKIDTGGHDNEFFSCGAFMDAFLAGDPAADWNKDGYVNGDDLDAFFADHPECSGLINPSNRDAANALRSQNRRVGVTPGDLLGLPGSTPPQITPRSPVPRPDREAVVRETVRRNLVATVRAKGMMRR